MSNWQRIALHRWGILLVLQNRDHLVDVAHLGVQRVHELLKVWNDLALRTWIQPSGSGRDVGGHECMGSVQNIHILICGQLLYNDI